MSNISISFQEEIERGVQQALDNLGDLSGLFRGKHVAVKPNDTWAPPRDVSACTQPDTLEAVIRYIKRFDPNNITVTGGDFVAADFIGARILGKENVEHIMQAERLQLGTATMKDIDIVGLPLAEAIQIFKKRSTDKRVEASSMRS